MTDEKIKEEFEEWAGQPFGEREIQFCMTTGRPLIQASAYYAGFRAAERMAKIEVLEELRDKSEYKMNPEMYRFFTKNIDELKAGQ